MQLKIDYISDLHIDFWISPKSGTRQKAVDKFVYDILKPLDGDVLVIAGDIGHKNFQMKVILEKLCTIYKDVIIVLGNHDLYIEANNPKKTRKDSLDRLIGIVEICDRIENVHFLRGDTIEIGGVTFGGTMGWYNFPEFQKQGLSEQEIQKEYLKRSSDIYYIKGMTSSGMYGTNTLNGMMMYYTEIEKIRFIQEKKVEVMITHVPPWISDENKLKAEFKDDLNYEYFDNEELLNDQLVWIHGHTHYDENTIHNGCLVVSSPLGYETDNLGNSIAQFILEDGKILS